MKTLLKNAKILTMKDEHIIEGSILIVDNLIEAVGDVNLDQDFDEVIDCEGNLLMPGFKNVHTHSAMTFLRSKADDSSLQDWLFNEIFPREANLKKGDVRELGKIAILEYLASGVTGIVDQYFFPEEFQQTCEEMGMRCLNLAMYDPDSRSVEDIANLYKGTKKDGLVHYVIGLHSEYTPTEEMFETTGKLLEEYKSPYYTHLSETIKEVEECYEKRGVSPLEFFDQKGFYKYGGAIFHGVYLSDHDIELLKKRDITVVSCPGSNMKLASGIANITKLLNAGVRVALGTDGPASNNSLDMFREMYLATGLQKILYKNPVSIPAFEILKMATVNGATVLREERAKYLDKGQLADIIMIDLTKPQMQPTNNMINNIVYAGSKDVIKMTMIDGKILYFNGKFLIKEKISDIYKKVSELTERLVKIN